MVVDLETGIDYLTPAEAASLIHVGEDAIRRWIEIGMLPSKGLEQEHVVVTRDDLAAFIRRARPSHPFLGGESVPLDAPGDRQITPEAREYGLAWLDEAVRLSKEIMESLGIEKFEPESWALLDEAREERTKQLG